MAKPSAFPKNLCMPTQDAGGVVYPFGRWSLGYKLADLDGFVRDVQRQLRTGLLRYVWCLFCVLFALSVAASTRHFGGPYLSLQWRPFVSTAIVTLPAILYFVGRRYVVYARVRGSPHDSYVGRLFVWCNVDNSFGAAVRHPQGALVVAPWLDAGRKYRLDLLSEYTARRIVRASICAELACVGLVCAVLMGYYHKPPNCIYGVCLYFSVLQPVIASIELHTLLPFYTQRFEPRTFDNATIIAKRYRWLRVFIVSSVYMATLLLTQGPQSLRPQQHAPMQTYLYLTAYATATCYATLSLVCLVKTWARPWSTGSLIKSFVARLLFLLAFVFLAASVLEPIKVDYLSVFTKLGAKRR